MRYVVLRQVHSAYHSPFLGSHNTIFPPYLLTPTFNGSPYSSFCGCSLGLYTLSYQFHDFTIHYQASFLTCNPVENPRPSSISQHLPNQSYLHFNARSLSQYSISLLVLQSVSKLLVIFHKGKSTNTSGESTMRKPTTYKNIVKCNDEETSDHFPQESLGNISERYTWKNELTLQQSG